MGHVCVWQQQLFAQHLASKLPSSPLGKRESLIDGAPGEMQLVLPEVTPVEELLFKEVLDEIHNSGWDLDTLAIAEKTGNRPLHHVLSAIFELHSLFDKCNIDRACFTNFAFMIDEGYIDNPYHNSAHAADVAGSITI